MATIFFSPLSGGFGPATQWKKMLIKTKYMSFLNIQYDVMVINVLIL